MSLQHILSDSSRKTADLAVDMILKEPSLIEDFFQFSIRADTKYAMRAARVLSIVAEKKPSVIYPYINSIIQKLPDIPHEGIKRGFARVLSEFSFQSMEENIGILVDQCFKWLNSSDEAIAIKVYSMDILYKVCLQIPELCHELELTIEDQIEKGGAAILSRGREVIGKLNRLKTEK